jgi:hypothetical protein
MVASVPSGTGQYRFVRVVRVLIFPGARSCVGFVLLHNSRPSALLGSEEQTFMPCAELTLAFTLALVTGLRMSLSEGPG